MAKPNLFIETIRPRRGYNTLERGRRQLEDRHMHFRISLFQKGLILVSVPLIFELISYGVLADLYKKAQADANQAERAREISDSINLIVRDFYDMITTIKSADFATDPSMRARKEVLVGKAFQEMRTVQNLVMDEPRSKALMDEVQMKARQANETLDQVKAAYDRNDVQECLRLRQSLNVLLKQIISPELLSLARQQKEIGDRSPERQAYFRQLISQQLAIFIAFSVLLTVVLAVIVSNGITRRLSILAENSLRLAREDELLPALTGSDEIAQVDQVFHTMAETLAEATRVERTLIENARDVICSIDKSGKFATVSPASSKVLGYSPEDLLGKHYIDLIVAEDVAHVLASMDALLAAEGQEPFETKIKRKDGALIDILFSAHWSNQEKTYFCVLHDITERKDAERMKQEVLAMVSHDLRTPLTAIRHLHEMLAMGTAGELPEGARKLVQRADAASKRMLTLVNDLLEIEKIRAGMMELNRTKIPAANLFDACMPIIAPLAEEKSVRLNIIETNIDVFADPNRIIQVIVNIASNAIKFSPQGSTVTISAQSKGNAVQIQVKDQGPGIPEHMRESIFNRFQQLQQGDDLNKGGTGLGLAICKAIVQLHGGEIWVECRKEEAGSTFIFTIAGAADSPT